MTSQFKKCAGVTCCAFVFAAAATAAEKPKLRKAAQASSPAQTSAARDGMRVTIDPVTRRPRAPEPAEAARLEALIGPRVESPETILRLPNGAYALIANPEHRDYAVAARKADGTVTFHCSHGTPAGVAKEMTSNER